MGQWCRSIKGIWYGADPRDWNKTAEEALDVIINLLEGMGSGGSKCVIVGDNASQPTAHLILSQMREGLHSGNR